MTRKTLLMLATLAVLAGCAGSDSTDGTHAPSGPADDPGAEPEDPVVATKETGVIRGTVVDRTIQPVAGAAVRIVSTGDIKVTNAAGAFGFDGLEPGLYFLNVTHPSFLSTQSSARVEAGVGQPDAIRIELVADPAKEPRFEQSFVAMRVPGDICVAADCRRVASGSNASLGVQTWAMAETTGVPKAMQIEVYWDAATDLGVWGKLDCRGTGATASQRFDTVYGVESIVLRVPGLIEGDDGAEPIDRLWCDFAADGDASPVVAMIDQDLETIITTFYNFESPADWTAAEYGEPEFLG